MHPPAQAERKAAAGTCRDRPLPTYHCGKWRCRLRFPLRLSLTRSVSSPPEGPEHRWRDLPSQAAREQFPLSDRIRAGGARRLGLTLRLVGN
jgi:hypothetical protein